jgi:hypothetical protein
VLTKNVIFLTNFWHSEDKSDFLPILQKMQNITIIYDRNACQMAAVTKNRTYGKIARFW